MQENQDSVIRPFCRCIYTDKGPNMIIAYLLPLLEYQAFPRIDGLI